MNKDKAIDNINETVGEFHKVNRANNDPNDFGVVLHQTVLKVCDPQTIEKINQELKHRIDCIQVEDIASYIKNKKNL